MILGHESGFEEALTVFLQTYKLYYTKENDIYYISRIRTEFDSPTGTISMDAEEVEMPFLIKAASRTIGKTILYDPLPSESLSVHVVRIKPEKLIDIIIKKFSEYRVEIDDDYYYIKRIPQIAEPSKTGTQQGMVSSLTKDGDTFSLLVEKSRFRDVIDNLFLQAGYEYSFLITKDTLLENLRFQHKTFEQLLRLVLEQANADFALIGDIYYIFEVLQRDILKKFKSMIRLPLTHISVQELPKLFPPDLLSSKFYKIDLQTNSVILNGSMEEITPIQDFILKIDQPFEGQRYYRFDLSYLDVENVKAVLPPTFQYIEPIIIPSTNSFVIRLSPENKEVLERYIALADQFEEAEMVKLKYIKAEDLLKKLPPSISPDDITETQDPSIIFIRGTSKKIQNVYRELKVLDRPTPQIKYQILVIQHQEGESLNWSDSVESSLIEEGAVNAFLGTIGQLLNLNFDIVSTFGYQFAVRLNLDLSNSKARVLADTTLNGTAGDEVKFQNTETYRYRDLEIDEQGNPKPTGVTREITAGLIFNITGWASGDGMVTMNINATVSKRGTDVSGTSGTLPPTSEHIITTNIRTRSGEPIVIGGLIRQEKSNIVSKIPLLGDIPYLGYLFQTRKDSIESSELVIYIVPHIDYAADYAASVEERLSIHFERLYQKFVRK